MKKWILILLMVCMTLFSFSACKERTDVPDDTKEGTEPPKATDQWGQDILDKTVPDDLNYGGATVHFLIRSGEQYRREWNSDTITTALDNEIFLRNERIQDRLGVYFDFIISPEGTNNSTINDRIINVGAAGIGGIDVVSNYRAFGNSLSLLQYYADLNDGSFTYLNFDQPYWNQKFIDTATVFDKLYMVVGDVNLSVYDRAIAVYFNETLCNANQITGLYETALAGDWTYEVLYGYVRDYYVDNGLNDASLDSYGLSTSYVSEGPAGMYGAFAIPFVERNDDGTHSLVSGSTLTKLDDAYEKVSELFSSKGCYTGHSVTSTMIDMFTEGRAMFSLDVIYHYAATNQQIRDMSDTYGLLPAPKYNSDQAEYSSSVQGAHNIMSVLDYVGQDHGMISAVLETLCADNYTNVRPYYFERIVKLQYFRDSNAGRVFDIILAGTKWDFSDIYSQSVGGIMGNLWTTPLNNGGSLFTAYAQYKSSISAALQKLDEWMLTH